jgi:hypothetical protein
MVLPVTHPFGDLVDLGAKGLFGKVGTQRVGARSKRILWFRSKFIVSNRGL